MKTAIKTTLAVVASAAALAGVATIPSIVSAWGDNSENGRPSYTIDEINNGAIGATFISDGANYKNSSNYPGQIIFNTISDSVIGNEKNFVGARECTTAGCGGATKETIWNANEINVEDGKTYIIRLYVHNNNPNGVDAVAENTKVRFNIPVVSSLETKVNGYITSSNASPSEYVDDVIFKSDTAFHLEYVNGSALLENNKVGLGGIKLSDDIVEAKDGGVLIGYDALDGRVPGCYEYANYVTIQVKAVYDTEFSVEEKVRIAGDADKTWKNTVTANIGDTVEFQIQYRNLSTESHSSVSVRDILPKSLEYVKGSTILYNKLYPNGLKVDQDDVVGDGILIGKYAGKTENSVGANAFVRFSAKVVGDNLACGANVLINWGQVQAGAVAKSVLQDYATVNVVKVCKNEPEPTPTPTPEEPEPTPELPNTGPEAIAGGIVAAGSIATAAGYYIASRRQLR